MKLILFTFCFLLLFFCCNNITTNNWKSIRINDIGDRKFDFLISKNKNAAIMLGGLIKDEDLISLRFFNAASVTAITKDAGESWAYQDIGSGKIGSYTLLGDFVFFVKRYDKKQAPVAEVDSSAIFMLNASGNDVNLVSVIPDFFIKDIFVESQREFFVVGKLNDDSVWVVKKTIDQGKTWKQVSAVHGSSFQYLNGVLYSLDHGRHVINKLELSSNMTQSIAMPSVFISQPMLTLTQNELVLSGETKAGISFFKLDKTNHKFQLFEELKLLRHFPEAVHLFDGRLAALVGERSSFGVIYSLCYRGEKSKEWEVDEVPVSFFSPFCFIQDEFWGVHLENLYKHKIR